MASTVQALQAQSEVWQNTSAGSRWYQCLDIQGRQTTRAVGGGRTFTLTTFERQLNQQMTPNPKADLFRNGTFVLRKPSEDTDRSEIESANALTNEEITRLAYELMYSDHPRDQLLGGVSSDQTLARLVETLVIEDADQELRDYVRSLMTNTVRAKVVSEPVVTKPDDSESRAAVAPMEAVTTSSVLDDSSSEEE